MQLALPSGPQATLISSHSELVMGGHDVRLKESVGEEALASHAGGEREEEEAYRTRCSASLALLPVTESRN